MCRRGSATPPPSAAPTRPACVTSPWPCRPTTPPASFKPRKRASTRTTSATWRPRRWVRCTSATAAAGPTASKWNSTTSSTCSSSCRRSGRRGRKQKERQGRAVRAGALRTVPLAGELTSSLINRAADRYALPAAGVLRLWTCRNSPARHGGGVRADAEVILNGAGRNVLAELCGVEPAVLARALPAFTVDDPKISTGREAALAQVRWRAAGAVAGEAAFACRLCTARRTGQAQRAVRYLPRWQRVCVRHGRWLLDADADQPLEHLDLHGVPEVVAAQRRWTGVARRAGRAGAEGAEVFALAHAVLARWWEEALHWEREEIWPHRLHRVAGGNAGTDLQRWRIVGRDPVIFPEVVAVADALLDPLMAELVWRDSGAGRPRPLPADGAFCRRLGEQVGRDWLGPLSAVDYGGPLLAWMGAVIRRRRDQSGPPGWRDDPWCLQREQQSATMA